MYDYMIIVTYWAKQQSIISRIIKKNHRATETFENIKYIRFVWEKEFQRRRLLPWEFYIPNIGIYNYVIWEWVMVNLNENVIRWSHSKCYVMKAKIFFSYTNMNSGWLIFRLKWMNKYFNAIWMSHFSRYSC